MLLFGPLAVASVRRKVATIVVLFVLAACSSPEERAAQHFERAMEHVEAGNDAKAMVELRNVLRIEPKNAEALYEVGLLHQRAERWPQAVEAFRAATAERAGYIAANMALGELALLGGEIDMAEGAAEAILAEHPTNTDGRILEAAVQLRRGELEAAVSTAQDVLLEDPTHEEAVAVLIGGLDAQGRRDEATARLDAALTRLPESVTLRILRIALYERAGDAAGARRTYEQLVELEPESRLHRLALADFFDRQGDVAGAESVLREAVETLDEGADLAGALVGLVYRERGAEAAEAELDRLITRAPDNARLRFLSADLLTRRNRIEEAEAQLQHVVDMGAREEAADANAAIARLRLAQEDVDSARERADAVLEDRGDHRGSNFVRGVVHLLDGEPSEALRKARAALERDPRWTPGLKLLAEAHLRSGQTDLAISTLREVVDADPQDAASSEMLATLLTQRGDLEAALDVWDRLVQQGAREDRARFARAQIRLGQENWTAAEADIRRLLDTPEQALGGTMLAGTLDLARERYDDSREWFGKALEMEPDTNQAVAGIVRAYVAQEDVEAALAFLDERTTTHAEDPFPFALKAELLTRQGELDAAAAAYERAIALAPQAPGPYRQLAGLRRAQGDAEAAVAVYERALAEMPEQPALLDEFGQSLVLAGRHAEALAVYEKLVALQPDNDVAANNFAALVADYAYEDEARLEKALDVAERFRASDNGLFLDTLGWLFYRNGDYAAASTFLGRAVAATPEAAQLRYHLGMALERTGDVEGALDQLRRAVAAEQSFDGLEEAERTLAALEAEAAAAEPAGEG